MFSLPSDAGSGPVFSFLQGALLLAEAPRLPTTGATFVAWSGPVDPNYIVICIAQPDRSACPNVVSQAPLALLLEAIAC